MISAILLAAGKSKRMEGENKLGKHSMLNENGQNYEVYFGFY